MKKPAEHLFEWLETIIQFVHVMAWPLFIGAVSATSRLAFIERSAHGTGIQRLVEGAQGHAVTAMCFLLVLRGFHLVRMERDRRARRLPWSLETMFKTEKYLEFAERQGVELNLKIERVPLWNPGRAQTFCQEAQVWAMLTRETVETALGKIVVERLPSDGDFEWRHYASIDGQQSKLLHAVKDFRTLVRRLAADLAVEIDAVKRGRGGLADV